MIKVVYGLKGSGKSLYAVSYIRRHRNHYAAVFTNISVSTDIADNVYFLNTCPHIINYGRKQEYYFDFSDKSFPRGSLIVIDESALVFNNRSFMLFSDAILNMLVYERRHELDFIFICQNPDMIDINILRLADEHILCNNHWGILDLPLKWLGFLKREHYFTELKVQDLDDWSGESSQVKVILVKDSKAGYTYPRKYGKYYNTYAEDSRPPYPMIRDFSSGV